MSAETAEHVNSFFSTNIPALTLTLMGATSLANLVALVFLLAYTAFFARKYFSASDSQNYVSKLGCRKNISEFLSFLVNLLFVIIELASTIVTYLSALTPYNTIQYKSDHAAASVRNWIDGRNMINGTFAKNASPPSTREWYAAAYFLGLSALMFLWGLLVPYFMTLSFRWNFGVAQDFLGAREESRKCMRYGKKCGNFLWHKLRMIPGFLIARVLVFVIGYYVKTIIVLFVVLPWELSLAKGFLRYNILFVVWSVVLSVLMLGCVTVQGSWLSIFRTMHSQGMKGQMAVFKKTFTALMKLDFKEAIGTAMATLTVIAKFCFFYTIHMLKHALKAVIGFPEPRALAANVYLCKRQMLFCLCEPRASFDEDQINTAIWTAFASSYTMIFILPLPVIGPYLWLVTAMFSRSGFWLSPFWLWLARTVQSQSQDTQQAVDNDVEMQEAKPTKDAIIYECRIERKTISIDIAVNVIKKFFEPLPNVNETFVNLGNDRGRVLRILSIAAYVLIPLLVLWCVLQNGFDVLGFLWCFFFSVPQYDKDMCIDNQLKFYNVTSCPYR